MPVFNYHAKDTEGQTISGEVMADDARMAARQVRELGYFPMRVQPGGPAVQTGLVSPAEAMNGVSAATGAAVYPQYGGRIAPRLGERAITPAGSWFERTFIYPVFTGVSLKDLALMYRQLAAMLSAGMSMSQSLNTLQQQSQGPLRQIVAYMNRHVAAGGKLSEALAMYPHIFSKLQRAIIEASEDTGSLDVMMGRLSDYIEQDYALRQLVKRETFLPKIQFAATFLIPTLVIAVVKGAGAYFQEAVMPLLRIIFDVALVVGVFRYLLTIRAFAIAYDTVKAYLPYFGTTVRMLARAKFSRALGALYAAGISVPRSVETAAKVAGNEYLAWAMGRSVESMNQGEGITDSFARTGAFPPMFLSMLSTGETTGSLDMVMGKVADFYEAESATRLKQSVVALNVLLTILMGIIVCITLVQFYTGNGYGGQIEQIMNSDN